jgi:chromosome condensin MukBEF ATPase and DNA-binding subunit MukB|tara:strand:- start:3 stop:203 length:201 start_codon:yes stop_codon:yes gene_type:complete
MIPVEGHKNLFRDEDSGAIVNHDNQGYRQYLQLKNKKLTEEEEIKRLRSDIDEIKSLLYEVLNKRL